MELFSGRAPSEAERLKETIDDINEALEAPNFNEEDRDEVERNLEYFRERRARLLGQHTLELSHA